MRRDQAMPTGSAPRSRRGIRRAIAVTTLAIGLMALAAAPALAASVGASDFKFTPKTITISVGETVTWTNNGPSAHTVTGASFDSGNLNPGDTFSHTFTSAGTFAYHCTYHQQLGMVGTVIVTGGGGGGGGGGSGTPLPNTGIGSGSLFAAVAGIALLLLGAVLLFGLRRRRA